jgi:outer membrane receptor protein involved in Fe transport
MNTSRRRQIGAKIAKNRAPHHVCSNPRTLFMRLQKSFAASGDDATNTQHPYYASNAQHSLSAQYQVTPQVTVRAGIINLTNEEPSYPSISYGDILGRRYFVGVNAH